MLGLKLNRVSKRGPRCPQQEQCWLRSYTFLCSLGRQQFNPSKYTDSFCEISIFSLEKTGLLQWHIYCVTFFSEKQTNTIKILNIYIIVPSVLIMSYWVLCSQYNKKTATVIFGYVGCEYLLSICIVWLNVSYYHISQNVFSISWWQYYMSLYLIVHILSF